ncbi:MAG TPA: helix-turn-helix domain-containing protein [Bacteroidia bacterium]|jgi:excisionase family DNA binding protein|nr:helix-turn-helix domain-containing protein [Bacteroidia bacterium]
METSTILHNVTPEQINSLFQSLQAQLEEIKQNFEPKTPTEYLTRSEVAEMLKCDLSTIHNWTKKGKLIPYGIGNRVYYKRHEIEAVLIPFGKERG